MLEPLWTPSPERAAASRMDAFRRRAEACAGVPLPDYDALHRWSIEDRDAFWSLLWDFTEVRGDRSGPARVGDAMPGTRWFPEARLNFAENLLRREGNHPALISVTEGGAEARLSWDELRDAVARFAEHLRRSGIREGDRVAGFLPNRGEAVVAMLATASLGATWSSCSPDFGFRGVMDRFGQIRPRVLVAAERYTYGGKPFDALSRARAIRAELPSIEQLVVLRAEQDRAPLTGGEIGWEDALAHPAALAFEALPFDHPLYIMYSSGTTGVPKCIVHGAGGTLLQHAKELVLHTDVGLDDVVFYFTTCGWMMWNWLVSSLMTGATVVLYDGSPAWPDLGALWGMAERLGVTVFGTSPKFLGLCEKEGLRPGEQHDLSRLRAVLSTGSPLPVDSFRWVYDAVGADLQLSSIAGGTDIISCFMLGSPIDPVYPGEIQKPGLGMRVEAWDETGHPVTETKGELVCAASFPSMPVGFWDDPKGDRYRAAYFEHFPGVWRHGDFVEITEHGGVIVYGRSDATLNPGGVRIGTAEIYRPTESMDEIADALVIGLPQGEDVEVVLFVVLREGHALDDALVARIRGRIRAEATPRHVPSRILAAPAVPRTISGKKMELAVLRAVQGQGVPNRDAMANPEAIDWFRPEVVQRPV